MIPAKTDFFEILSKYDIWANNVENVIYSLKANRFFELANELSDHLPRISPGKTTIFDFIANNQLSGQPDICSALECRLKGVNKLGRFAALYAERILIRDPFIGYVPKKRVSSNLRERLVNEIKIVLSLKPVIEAGIIQFTEPPPHICTNCILTKNFGDEEIVDRLAIAQDLIINQYVDTMSASVKYQKEDESYLLKVNGPECFIEHGELAVCYSELPSSLEFLKDLASSRTKKLTKEQVVLVAHTIANPALNDVYMHNLEARLSGCQYLTDRSLDLELISLLEHPRQKQRSQALIEGFSHNIPELDNVSLDSLISLRMREHESFKVYKDALEAALKNVDKTNPKQVRELFRDTVEIELNKLNLSMRNSARTLKSIAGREAVISMGVMMIGLFAGILPHDIGNFLAAVGGVNAIRSVAGKTLDSFHEPKDVKDNKFYFLWKATKLRQDR